MIQPCICLQLLTGNWIFRIWQAARCCELVQSRRSQSCLLLDRRLRVWPGEPLLHLEHLRQGHGQVLHWVGIRIPQEQVIMFWKTFVGKSYELYKQSKECKAYIFWLLNIFFRSKTTCVDFCHPDFSWKNKQCNLIQNYLCEFGWTDSQFYTPVSNHRCIVEL